MGIAILFSGGQDSCALLELAQTRSESVHCLHFSYNHPAEEAELRSSKSITDMANVPLFVKKLPIEATEMSIGIGTKGSRFVPNRNAIFIMHAVQHCVQHDIKEIWLGANKNDQNDYPDCTPDFIEAVQKVVSMYRIQIKAPLINTSKCQIQSKYKNYAFSCYEPIHINDCWIQCGKCNSCIESRVQILEM